MPEKKVLIRISMISEKLKPHLLLLVFNAKKVLSKVILISYY